MNKCCEEKLTAYCEVCGTNLKSRSLVGLVEDLERRISKAGETLKKWNAAWVKNADENLVEQKKAKRGVARTEETIHRLSSWLDLLKAKVVV